CLILARISDARDGDTHGVDGQVDDGMALAARLGWHPGQRETHVIIENDTSAFKRRKVTVPGHQRPVLRTVRPGFRRALDMLWTGEADGLIALDLDRTCRDPRDLEDLIDVVESKTPRIPVDSVTGSLRLATDADITMARVMVAMANKSSRDTARRVSAARERQALAGQYGGGRRPYGFEDDGRTVHSDEAGIIAECSRALVQGASLRSIALDLRERKLVTVAGAPWRAEGLREVLLRARNAGRIVYRGEEIGDAPWAPIVPLELFRAVQRILTEPGRVINPG